MIYYKKSVYTDKKNYYEVVIDSEDFEKRHYKFTEIAIKFVNASENCIKTFENEGASAHLFNQCNEALLLFDEFLTKEFELEGYDPKKPYNPKVEKDHKKAFRRLLGSDQTFESEIYWIEYSLARKRMAVATKENISLLKEYQIKHTFRAVDLMVALVVGPNAVNVISADLINEWENTWNLVPYPDANESGDPMLNGIKKLSSRATNKYVKPGEPQSSRNIDLLPNIIFSAIATEQFIKYCFIKNNLSFEVTLKDEAKPIIINPTTLKHNTGKIKISMVRNALLANNILNEFILIETEAVADRRNKLAHNGEFGYGTSYAHSISTINDIYKTWISKSI